jgi:hypothetical protein
MFFFLRSSLRPGWPLRNIYFSNDNGSFPFYADFLFHLSPTRLAPGLIIWVTGQVSYKRQDLLTLCEHLSLYQVFRWSQCCSPFQFYVLLGFFLNFVHLRPVCCVEYWRVSLDFQFMLVPWLLSNVNLRFFKWRPCDVKYTTIPSI